MSVYRAALLVCDSCEQEYSEFADRAAQVRADARQVGWIRVGEEGRDICTACSDSPVRHWPTP